MSKITRGRWDWKLNADTIDFYADGKPLHPTIADAELICSALEMYDLLCELVDTEQFSKIHKAREVIERIQRKEH